jgi:hypothetical protein
VDINAAVKITVPTITTYLETIGTNGGWDNWHMVVIEEYPCDNTNAAAARERYWVEQLNATLNANVPDRSSKEYKKDSKAAYTQSNK